MSPFENQVKLAMTQKAGVEKSLVTKKRSGRPLSIGQIRQQVARIFSAPYNINLFNHDLHAQFIACVNYCYEKRSPKYRVQLEAYNRVWRRRNENSEIETLSDVFSKLDISDDTKQQEPSATQDPIGKNPEPKACLNPPVRPIFEEIKRYHEDV